MVSVLATSEGTGESSVILGDGAHLPIALVPASSLASGGTSLIWTPAIPGQTGPVAFTDIHDVLAAALVNGDGSAAVEIVVFAGAFTSHAVTSSIVIPPNTTWRASGSGGAVLVTFGDGVHITGFLPLELDAVLFVSTKTVADPTPVYTSPGGSGLLQTLRCRGDEGGLQGSAAIAPVPFAFVQAGDTLVANMHDTSILQTAAIVPQAGGTVTITFDGNATMVGTGAVPNAGTLNLLYFDNGGQSETDLSVTGVAPSVANFRALAASYMLNNVVSAGGAAPAAWNGLNFTATPRQPTARFTVTAACFDAAAEEVSLRVLIDGVAVAAYTFFDAGTLANLHCVAGFKTVDFPVTIGPHTCGVDFTGGTVNTNPNDRATLILEQ